ncbi:MAG: hypothetical protein KA236_08095 [Verrucomicrobia bacterium]|nr:hypothetical protein [Verrucomicrobiota bacterium]
MPPAKVAREGCRQTSPHPIEAMPGGDNFGPEAGRTAEGLAVEERISFPAFPSAAAFCD